MPSISNFPSAAVFPSALRAQNFDAVGEEVMRYAVIFLAVLFLSYIVLFIFRRASKGKSSLEDSLIFDDDQLGGLQQKGLLTPEERKKIAQAMVRRAMSENTPQKQTTLQDLQRIVSAGPEVSDIQPSTRTIPRAAPEAADEPEAPPLEPQHLKPPAAPAPSKPVEQLTVLPTSASLQEKVNARLRKIEVEPPPQPQPEKPQTVDIDLLHDKGILSDEEYERLRALSQQIRDES